MDTPRPALLMTRPRAASERFVSALPVEVADRVEVCIAPLMEIALSDAPITAADAQGVIFSSANGVQAARAAGLEPRLPAFCIGRATTAAATGAGWNASFAGEDADALVATLARTRPATPLLHLHGAHTRGDIAGRLTAAGLPTRGLPVYDQRLLPLSPAAKRHLAGQTPVIAPLFSPRTARQFAEQIAAPDRVHAIALSPAVAEVLAGKSFASLVTVDRPEADLMIGAIAGNLARLCRVEGRGEPQ